MDHEPSYRQTAVCSQPRINLWLATYQSQHCPGIWSRANAVRNIIYVLDLKALSRENRLIKYSDDTILLVAENSPVDLATEFSHIEERSKDN